MSLEFIKQKLTEYYEKYPVRAPYKIGEREFGFGNDKKIDYRHFKFNNERVLQNYFVTNAPLYASFSAAYYEFPAARPMQKKNWKGADLIFEFDADFETLTDEKTMEKAKQDSFSLIEDFLIPDFGISKEDISITFSGNRGYHIYVVNDEIQKLNAKARREISDYLMGNGLDVKTMMKKNIQNPVGWEKRFQDVALKYVDSSNRKEFNDAEKKEYARQQILNWNFDVIRGAEKELQKQLEKRKINITAQIDQGVTLDISRLIRLPSTIHGGSSLLCDFVDLNKYNPFVEGVVFGDNDLKIKLKENVEEIMLKNQSFGSFKKDQEVIVPEFVAMFLICKGKAEPLK